MKALRSYQKECVEHVLKALTLSDSVVAVCPTGSGKSLICAEICSQTKGKVLVLCHQSEILKQNFDELLESNPHLDAGIYCAKLGQKKIENDVTFASRDSFKNLKDFPQFSLVIIDEAHLVPKSAESSYQKIIEGVGCKKSVGLTATPYRLDGGLIYGKGKQFDFLAYEIPMRLLIDAGYLCDYRIPKAEKIIETKDVKLSSNGEYDLKQLEDVSSSEEIIKACVESFVSFKKNLEIKRTICFCVSIKHAEKVSQELNESLIKAAYISGEMDTKLRNKTIEDFKEGRTEVLCNVGVMTTGVNIPAIDCVLLLRATQSTSLYVQMIGRGLRVFKGKEFCNILDFTDTVKNMGSPEFPTIKRGKSDKDGKKALKDMLDAYGIEHAKGPAPVRRCRWCHGISAASSRECKHCGELFVGWQMVPYLTAQNGEEYDFDSVTTELSVSAKGNPMTVVKFKGKRDFTEYLVMNQADKKPEFHEALMNKLEKIRLLEKKQMPFTALVVDALSRFPRVIF